MFRSSKSQVLLDRVTASEQKYRACGNGRQSCVGSATPLSRCTSKKGLAICDTQTASPFGCLNRTVRPNLVLLVLVSLGSLHSGSLFLLFGLLLLLLGLGLLTGLNAEATAVCRFGHTLYTTGYHTDGFEEEGVVWKEGQELFDLSDGSGSGSMPYSVAVCYDDIFTAGTIFGTTRTAVVWHGDEIRYTLSDGTGHSEAYSMYVVPLYD